MNTPTIAPITTREDLLRCAPLLVSAYNNPPWNDHWSDHDAFRKLETAFRCPDFIGFLATYDGDVQGALVGNIEPYFTGDYYYLRDMFTRFESQHQGCGRALLAHLLTHLDSRSIKQVILFTSKDHFAHDFYERMGFSQLSDMCMMLRT
jgi:GNAT superfamily N-acetyltransferase